MLSFRRSTPACVKPCVWSRIRLTKPLSASDDCLRVKSKTVHVRTRTFSQPLCSSCGSPVAFLGIHPELIADRLVCCVIIRVAEGIPRFICGQRGTQLVKDPPSLVIDMESKN